MTVRKFIKKIRKRKEDNPWDYSNPYDEVWEDKEEHSMWKGLKEALRKKLGLC